MVIRGRGKDSRDPYPNSYLYYFSSNMAIQLYCWPVCDSHLLIRKTLPVVGCRQLSFVSAV